MRIHPLLAAVGLALSCALFAVSCVQNPASPPESDPDEAQSSIGVEQTGEAQQAFGSKAFRFVVDVRDDGEGLGGGWQKAYANLHFIIRDEWNIPIEHWKCPLVVGMPIRSEKEGRISPSRAALINAEIANDVTEAMKNSRDWQGQGALHCIELKNGMQQMFRSRYPGIGAKVQRP